MAVPAANLNVYQNNQPVAAQSTNDAEAAKLSEQETLQREQSETTRDLSRSSSPMTAANVSYAFINGKLTPIGRKSTENIRSVTTETGEGEETEEGVTVTEDEDIPLLSRGDSLSAPRDFRTQDSFRASAYALTAASYGSDRTVKSGSERETRITPNRNNLRGTERNRLERTPREHHAPDTDGMRRYELNRHAGNERHEFNRHDKMKDRQTNPIRQNRDSKLQKSEDRRLKRERDVKREVRETNNRIAKTVNMNRSTGKTVTKTIKVGKSGKAEKTKRTNELEKYIDNKNFNVKINYVDGKYQVERPKTQEFIAHDKYFGDIKQEYLQENPKPTREQYLKEQEKEHKTDDKNTDFITKFALWQKDYHGYLNEQEKVYQSTHKEYRQQYLAFKNAQKKAEQMNAKLRSYS